MAWDLTSAQLVVYLIGTIISGDSITDGHILGNDKTQIEDSDYYNDAISRTDVDIEGYLWDTDPETGTVPIPYKIDHNIDDQTRDNIDQAISEFHRDTCIRFSEVFGIPSGDYLFFKASTSCKSRVGKKVGTNEQSFRVGGCESFGQVLHEILHMLGFYHQISRFDRSAYVDIDFKELKKYEMAISGGRVTNVMLRQIERCDRTKIAKKKGCQQIGQYDGDSIMHYPPILSIQVLEDGKHVNKTFRIFTLKDEAHSLCEGGRCNPGQRNGLSTNDIKKIKALYNTTCVNCVWSSWHNGECSKACGGGERTNVRYKKVVEGKGGICSGGFKVKENCNTHVCQADRMWDQWGDWTACSEACGGGNQTRIRLCSDPPAQNGTTSCNGNSLYVELKNGIQIKYQKDTQSCNDQPCPTDWNAYAILISILALVLIVFIIWLVITCRRNEENEEERSTPEDIERVAAKNEISPTAGNRGTLCPDLIQ